MAISIIGYAEVGQPAIDESKFPRANVRTVRVVWVFLIPDTGISIEYRRDPFPPQLGVPTERDKRIPFAAGMGAIPKLQLPPEAHVLPDTRHAIRRIILLGDVCLHAHDGCFIHKAHAKADQNAFDVARSRTHTIDVIRARKRTAHLPKLVFNAEEGLGTAGAAREYFRASPNRREIS